MDGAARLPPKPHLQRQRLPTPQGPAPLDSAYIQKYGIAVKCVWDASKSDANLQERGFDFEFASLVFEHPMLVAEDIRHDYGERRMVAIGLADGLHLTVVFTDRTGPDGEIERRVISARRSNRPERRLYDQEIASAQNAESRPR